MNLLLDTGALLALAGSVGNLSKAAAEALGKADEVFVSSVSIWEIAIKSASKKLKLSIPPWDWFEAARERYALRELPLDARAALGPQEKAGQTTGIPVILNDANCIVY